MSACCVSGCKNRHSSTSKLKFYRIPSGFRPFQANRRRLWLQAIQQVNGSTEELKGNSRICGAHFISGEASMDHDSPDFLPSVFTCSKPSACPKKRTKRYYRRRRRHRHKSKVETEGKTSPLTADSSVNLQSSVLMEIESELNDEKQTPSDSSNPKEQEPLTEEAKRESEGTSSPNKTSPSFKAAETPMLMKMSPVVLLKPIVSPTGGFQCEVCNLKVVSLSELVKHKQMHKEENESFICERCGKSFTSQADFTEHQHDHMEEPSFSCNMCDRSFTTNHDLKRHKLLHIKDARKCPMCGVLFCRRHNHVVFQPQIKAVIDSEEDSSVYEQQTEDISESTLLKESAEREAKPEPKTNTTPTAATYPYISLEIPVPKLVKTLHHPPPPRPIYPRTPGTSSQLRAPLLSYPVAVSQPAPSKPLELPGSLKIFSPQFLTSALLEVERNYEYILSKPGKVKDEMNEEPSALPLISPDDHSAKQVQKERTAYDLEITL